MRTRRSSIERLEDRRLLTVFTVSNIDDAPASTADDSLGTLRQAVFDSGAAGSEDTGNESGDFSAQLPDGLIQLKSSGETVPSPAGVGVSSAALAAADFPGPAPFGTAIGVYDPATGEIVVSVNDVVNWFVMNVDADVMTGGDPMGLPTGGGAVTDTDELIGEVSLFSPLNFTDLNLGFVAQVGLLDLENFLIFWNESLGSPLEMVPLVFADGFVNIPPVADINGPFVVDLPMGDLPNITLDASGSFDEDFGTLTYTWDLDDDGTFEIDTGSDPTLSIPDVETQFGIGDFTVTVMVSDGLDFDVASTTVSVVGSPAEEDPSLIVTTSADVVDAFDFQTSLREAVAFANSRLGADTVSFDTGVFSDPQTIQLDSLQGEILISDALIIEGPGSGLLTIDASDGDTIRGNGMRIFNVESVPNNFDVAISGMTLTGGDVDGDGGAIRSVEGLRLVDVVVTGNFATGSGGGASINSPGVGVDMAIVNSIFSNNESGSEGGGLAFRAAIDVGLIMNSSFIDNRAVFSGGGLLLEGPVSILRGTVTGNRLDGSDNTGGGIFANGELILSYSNVSNNIAGNDNPYTTTYGGGLYTRGNATISNSTISGNQAIGNFEAQGGGIFSFTDGGLTLVNSTISGNSTITPMGAASEGGGIFAQGDLILEHATVTNNSSYGEYALGGGVFSTNVVITITNSILAGNMADGGNPDLQRFGLGSPTVDFSLIGDTTGTAIDGNTGVGNLLNVDPRLGPLADNGGLTFTHTLLADSPAINAGDPNLLNPPLVDQRGTGFGRIAGGRIDIGAFELQMLPEVPSLIVTTPQDVVDAFDNLTSLREAVAFANDSPGENLVTFDVGVFNLPRTIALEMGEIEITEALTLDGPGQDFLTIDAQQNSRIFNITTTSGDFTIAGVTLTGGRTTGDNVSISDTTFSGGAIRSLTTGNLRIDQSIISSNSTTGFRAKGGGVFASGDVTITDSKISGNSTMGIDADGGGVFARGGVMFIYSTVSGNSTMNEFADGGGVSAANDVTLTNSTVSGNSTMGNNAFGGGVEARGNVTLTNSTLSGNSTTGEGADGGGIFVQGELILDHATVTNNHSYGQSTYGGGFSGTVVTRIANSIIAGNTANGNNSDLPLGIGSVTVDFSLIGDTTGTAIDVNTGVGNLLNVDPRLGPLADNGGLTFTHTLLADSPAINAGDPNFTSPPDFDQRGLGFDRIQGNRIDIGALETPFQPLNLGDRVWFDLNNDGLFGFGETGIDEVVVNLFLDANGDGDIDDVGDFLQATAITAGGGFYLFENLLPGDYAVQIDPSNFLAGGPLEGFVSSTGNNVAGRSPDPNDDVDNDDNGDPLAGFGVVSRPVTLSREGEPTSDGDGDANTNLTLDFGFTGIDLAISQTDSPDPVQSGEAIRYILTISNNSQIDVAEVVVTNTLPSRGIVLVGSSVPTSSVDNNVLTFILPSLAAGSSSEITIDVAVDSDFSEMLVNTAEVRVAEGDVNLADNTSVEETEVLLPTLSLGDRVWFDLNNDGLLGSGEDGIDDVVVNLFRDTNDDGEFTGGVDEFLASDTTTADPTLLGGFYRFEGLSSGDYLVQIDPSNFLAGGPLAGFVSSTGNETNGIAPDPDDNVDSDDNGQLVPGSGIVSRAITLSIANEPMDDGDSDSNSNFSLDFGISDTLIIDLIEGSDDPVAQLINSLINPGSGIIPIDVSGNFVGRVGDGFNPNTAQSGTFTGFERPSSDPALPEINNPDGIFLTTGVANIQRTNTDDDFDHSLLGINPPGNNVDTDLTELLSSAEASSSDVFDVNSIEFSFTVTPGMSSIEVDFVFATEEFPEELITDIFAFFIDGVNYATFPDGSLVGFSEGTNAQQFNSNLPIPGTYRLEYNGISNSLHLVGLLNDSIPIGGVHTIKIAIADTFDDVFDSGVFLGNLVAGNAMVGGIRLPIIDLNGDLPGIDTSQSLDENIGAAFGVTTSDLFVSEEGDTIDGATVTIAQQSQSGAGSLDVDTGATNLLADFDTNTSVLTLTGSATPEVYQDVLRTLTYQSGGVANSTPIQIELRVLAGNDLSLPATATFSFEDGEIILPPEKVITGPRETVEPPQTIVDPESTLDDDPGEPTSTASLILADSDEASSGEVVDPPKIDSPKELVPSNGSLAKNLLTISRRATKEELTDALFYLIDNEQVSLLAIDMGDEPIPPEEEPEKKTSKKKEERITAKSEITPQPMLAVSSPTVRPIHEFILGGLTAVFLIVGGQWLWRRSRKKRAAYKSLRR